MTTSERKLLILMAQIMGPASRQWREIRELLDKVKDEDGNAD